MDTCAHLGKRASEPPKTFRLERERHRNKSGLVLNSPLIYDQLSLHDTEYVGYHWNRVFAVFLAFVFCFFWRGYGVLGEVRKISIEHDTKLKTCWFSGHSKNRYWRYWAQNQVFESLHCKSPRQFQVQENWCQAPWWRTQAALGSNWWRSSNVRSQSWVIVWKPSTFVVFSGSVARTAENWE